MKSVIFVGVVGAIVAASAVEIDPLAARWTFGAHESAAMYRRVGKRCTGGIDGNARWMSAWLDWFDAHAPEKMEEIGLNFLHTRFYKGMGWEIEKRDFPHVKTLVENCRRHGVHPLAYVQFATLYPEAMRREIPDVDTWSSVNAKGEPNVYGSSYFRTMPCLTCRAWEDYLKRMCTIALTEAAFEGIMFDNVFAFPCYCTRCQKAFRAYLKRTVKDPVGRFGYDALDNIDLPRVNTDTLKREDIRDPVVQAWLMWRVETMDGVMARLRSHIKSIRPEAIVSGNPSAYRMRKRHVECGENMTELARHFDLIVMQSGCAPAVRANGEISNRLRELKFAQDYGPRIVALCDGDAMDVDGDELSFLLPMVEDLAFGGIPTDRTILSPAREDGFVDKARFAFRKPLHARFNDFVRKHRAELSAPSVHSVRLFYPERELMFSEEAHQGLLAAEEIFIRARVPFGYLVSTPAKPLEVPAGTDVIVVSGLAALSDAQVAALTAYAQKGGRLLVTGRSGRYDACNAERFEDTLVHGVKGLSNAVVTPRVDAHKPARYDWTSHIPPPKDGGRALMSDLARTGWKPPVTFVGLPDSVAAEYRRLPDGSLVVFLINYDIKHPVAGAHIALDARQRATALLPFEGSGEALTLPADGSLPTFGLCVMLRVTANFKTSACILRTEFGIICGVGWGSCASRCLACSLVGVGGRSLKME